MNLEGARVDQTEDYGSRYNFIKTIIDVTWSLESYEKKKRPFLCTHSVWLFVVHLNVLQ